MAKTKAKTRRWDAAEHLETEEDMAAYLEAALEDGDPALVAAT
ncbi:MAG: putative addiction module antidote protein, partial [Candidatus Binatia bacterium]